MSLSKKTHQQAITMVLRLSAKGLTHHEIGKRMMAEGYPAAKGGKAWYHATVQRILDAHESKAKPMPKMRAPGPQPAPEAEARRGMKRMTRAGWESLPEPVREAVVDRIYKDVVGL